MKMVHAMAPGETGLGDQLRLKLERPRDYRREDFVVSPANAAAVEALERWPNWHGGALALVGPEGAGKTHLARIWAGCVEARIIQGNEARTVSFDPATTSDGPLLVEAADQLADPEALFHLINRAARPGALPG